MVHRVVLAHHDVDHRWALHRTFQRSEQVDVVAEGDGAAEAFDLVREHRPDGLVLDLGRYERDGLWAVRRLARARPDLAVVALADLSVPDLLERTLRSGAAGVVHREAGAVEVVAQVAALLDHAELLGYPEPA